MKNFDVELIETKTHVYTAITANSLEEAISIAEGMKADGDEGEVVEIEQVSVDGFETSEEL